MAAASALYAVSADSSAPMPPPAPYETKLLDDASDHTADENGESHFDPETVSAKRRGEALGE